MHLFLDLHEGSKKSCALGELVAPSEVHTGRRKSVNYGRSIAGTGGKQWCEGAHLVGLHTWLQELLKAVRQVGRLTADSGQASGPSQEEGNRVNTPETGFRT